MICNRQPCDIMFLFSQEDTCGYVVKVVPTMYKNNILVHLEEVGGLQEYSLSVCLPQKSQVMTELCGRRLLQKEKQKDSLEEK